MIVLARCNIDKHHTRVYNLNCKIPIQGIRYN
nr:MAG TPA: hypothetical protein [Inoviridae sp.]